MYVTRTGLFIFLYCFISNSYSTGSLNILPPEIKEIIGKLVQEEPFPQRNDKPIWYKKGKSSETKISLSQGAITKSPTSIFNLLDGYLASTCLTVSPCNGTSTTYKIPTPSGYTLQSQGSTSNNDIWAVFTKSCSPNKTLIEVYRWQHGALKHHCTNKHNNTVIDFVLDPHSYYYLYKLKRSSYFLKDTRLNKQIPIGIYKKCIFNTQGNLIACLGLCGKKVDIFQIKGTNQDLIVEPLQINLEECLERLSVCKNSSNKST